MRENLRERAILLRVAPHLVRPLAVHVPLYRAGVRRRATLRAGMILYDLLSRRTTKLRRRWIARDQLLALEPGLAADGLRGAWRFYDAQCELVERLVVENVLDAKAHGAAVLTHARVARWLREDAAVVGAEVADRISGRTLRITARQTIDATGAWLDGIGPHDRPLLRLTKGVHLVTPAASRHAFLHFGRDGRPVFVLPWLGSALVGTTDTDFEGDPSDARATAADVSYLVDAAREILPDAPVDQVAYTFAGIRALQRVAGVREGQIPREHRIRDHAKADGVQGIVSIVGGKLTAHRGIAQEAVDAVAGRLGVRARCTTMSKPLPGAAEVEELTHELAADAARWGLAEDQLQRLTRVYGALARGLVARIERDPALAERLAPASAATRVEVVHAVESEDAVTLADVLLRRTCLGLALDRALPLAEAAAETLGWGRAEVGAYLAEVGAGAASSEPARTGAG